MEKREKNRASTPGGKLYEQGYEDLVYIRAGEKAPFEKSWTEKATTALQAEKWDGNLGLRAKHFPAIDIDLHDENMAQEVAKLALKHLGRAPLRRSHRPASLLLPYRADMPFTKRVLSLEGDKGKIEVLGEGQQYLVYGIHPEGTPYSWAGSPLWEIDPAQLSPIAEGNVDEFLKSVQKVYGGTISRSRVARDEEMTPEELAAPSLEAVEGILREMPNNDAFLSRAFPRDAGDSYKLWVNLGHAVKGALGAEGLQAFLDWTGRYEDGHVDLDRARLAYEGFDPRRYGWPQIDNIWIHQMAPPPENVFEFEEMPAEMKAALLSPLQAAITSLGDNWRRDEILYQMEEAERLMSGLSPEDQRRLEPFILSEITRVLRAPALARQVWSGAELYHPGLDIVGGRRVMFPADPTEIARTRHHLVEGLIPVGSVCEIIAGYSTGKTMLTLDLALSVAFGTPFMGHNTVAGRVLYMAYEGQLDLWVRVAAWLHHHGHLPHNLHTKGLRSLLNGRFLVPRQPLQFDHPGVDQILRDTIETYDIDLVVIDTRSKSLGALDENGASDASRVQAMLSGIAQGLGCSFLSLHHIGHSKEAKRRARGSSAWSQGADRSFIVEGSREKFDRGERMVLKPEKVRDGLRPDPISYRLRAGIDLVIDGRPESGAVVELDALPTILPLLARVFLKIRDEPGISKGGIRRGITGPNDDIQAAVSDLESRGAVAVTRKANRHSHKVVPGWHVRTDGEVGYEDPSVHNPCGVGQLIFPEDYRPDAEDLS